MVYKGKFQSKMDDLGVPRYPHLWKPPFHECCCECRAGYQAKLECIGYFAKTCQELVAKNVTYRLYLGGFLKTGIPKNLVYSGTSDWNG